MKIYRVVIKSDQHEAVSFVFDDFEYADRCYSDSLEALKEFSEIREGDSVHFEVYDAELVSTKQEIIQ